MNSNRKIKTIILIFLGIFFAFSPIFTTSFSFIMGNSNTSSEYSDEPISDKKNLQISAISGKIHIDNNWTATKAAGICTGLGTYSEPYVIEDLEIDGGDSGSCILIENSDVYFRIENCTLYYSSGTSGNAGIRLFEVNNSQLIDNECSFNAEGIYLLNCNNNTITGNNVSNNHNGINLIDSNNNIISQNNVSDNMLNYGGIMVGGNNNTISENIAYRDGILLWGKNRLSGNVMNGCGLRLGKTNFEDLAYHSIDTTNLVNEKPLYYYSNEVNLVPDDFLDAGQVIMVNCSDSLISNLNISNTIRAISLHYCIDSEISNNIVNNNFLHGILLENCDNNIVSDNIANNYTYIPMGRIAIGIDLSYSDNNTVSGNTVNNNADDYGYGIRLIRSNKNIVSRNTVNNIFYSGICISINSRNNKVMRNHITNNGKGIYLTSDDNIVSGNTANDNEYGIYLEFASDNNIVLNCLNNSINVVDDGSNNHWDNGIKGNYWADYTGLDTDGNGIGDTPYNISGSAGSKDNFPLMKCADLYPGSFTLSSDADSPDIDGNFILTWSISAGADNYSIYTSHSYITEINSSLTLLAYQNATTPFPISGLNNGTYHYIIVAYNKTGYTLSNSISVNVNIPPPLPGSFTLSSDADSPDIDGNFTLTWSISAGADNYSIYTSHSYITEINSSLTLLAYQNATTPFPISRLNNGTYHYIIVAYNKTGYTLSNSISVNVNIPPPRSQVTPEITGYDVLFLLGILSIVAIIISKKVKKS